MTSTDTVIRGPVKKVRPEPVTRTVTRRSTAGKDLGSVDLEPSIFGIEPNRAVLHQVVTAQLAAIRAGTQSTKTRAQVRGGGAKPFAQKGTGRARQGSSRSPSMSGGGVALGPKPRSYRQHTPKKMVRLALLSALSDRAANNRVALVDEWGWDGPEDQGRRGDACATSRSPGPCSSSWPMTRRSPAAPSPTCPTPTPPRSGSSPPTTCCAATGSCSRTAPCPERPERRTSRQQRRWRSTA